VLPAQTAGPVLGFRNDPLGMLMVIGLRQPWFIGISVPIRRRSVYNIAEWVIAGGALIGVSIKQHVEICRR
jgi:hypothetical protein